MIGFTSHYLWLEVEVTGDPPPLVELVRHGLSSPWPAIDRLQASFTPSGPDRWAVHTTTVRPGVTDARTFDDLGDLAAAELLYRMTHALVAERADEFGWGRLHAAVVDVNGRRLVLAGPSGAGKTTLARELARRGATLQSDEAALVRDGQSVGLPRRVHVKDSAEVDATEMAQIGALRLDYDPAIWAIDPPRHDALTCAPVEAIVLLGERGPDRPHFEPVPGVDAFSALITEAAWFSPAGLAVSTVSELLRSTPVWRLSGHDLATGARALEEFRP